VTLDAGQVALAAHLKSRGLAPLNPTRAPLAECRAMTERIGAVLNEGSVPLELERDLAIPGPGGAIPCRIYLPDGVARPPLLVYAHGGSFALGALASWDGMLRELVRGSGAAVLSVGYRLAPEQRFPAGFDDMLAALHYAAREGATLGIDPTRLAVGGDSADANLALGSALALRDGGASPVCFMLLIYGVCSASVRRALAECAATLARATS
jgi:acetyl esterase